MDVIYEPKGAAKEYADLAVNLFIGCQFACTYCWAPQIAYKKLDEWSVNAHPKANILSRLEKDACKIHGDPREILLCFTCDPYQGHEASILTRKALLILEKYELTATILTKAGMNAVQDFDILKQNDWQFGTTLSTGNEFIQAQWEPFAANVFSRAWAIKMAHDRGIKTWVSMEPVYDPPSALQVIPWLHEYVDFWKVGKMNHRKLDIDWPKFRTDVVKVLDSVGAKYYIKKELRDA